MEKGLDALQPMIGVASQLHGMGFTFAMRYLKNLTAEEIGALHGSDIALGLIFEQAAGNALKGANQGTLDGDTARRQAAEFGAPDGSVIFATVDTDVVSSQLTAINNYMSAFAGMIGPAYSLGIYGCGTVLKGLPNAVGWLAGATGWSGSKTYNDWIIKQGPTFSGGSWEGQSWPDIGFPYDPNLAQHTDWAWAPSRIPPRPTLPVLRMGDEGPDVKLLQEALAAHPIPPDGDFGRATDYAVRSFQQSNHLTVDGVVGPATWAALGINR